MVNIALQVALFLLSCLSLESSVALSLSGRANSAAPTGTLHRRSYFYVGGELSQLGDLTVDSGQIYVERLTPQKVTQDLPILLIHGHAMTGTNFLNTPDGRLGWADHFMSQGFEVFIIDQPSRGRSAWIDGVDGAQDTPDTFNIESRFTATQRFNFWPQASLHTQWPGNGSVGDLTFDNLFASVVPSLLSNAESSERIKQAGSQLLDEIGPVILLTHSQSGPFGWILADARPAQVKAIIALEPTGPPFQDAVFTTNPARPFGLTEIPISFSPPITSPNDLRRVVVSTGTNFTCFQQAPPARRLVNLARIPVLVVTSQSGYHAVYDDCTVQFLQEAGVSAQHVKLEDVGILGNGHLMFMEMNNLEIADKVVLSWIRRTVKG